MDKNSWIAYSKVHEYLMGRFPTARTYEDRIVAQKIGYLVQSSGIYLGDLDFFWHKRGPFSKVLSSMLSHIERNKVEIIETCSRVRLREDAISKLNEIKIMLDKRPKLCPEVIWLELIGSLKFLSRELKTDNFVTLIETLFKRKLFLKDYFDSAKDAHELLFTKI